MDDRDDKKKEAILHGSESREKEGIKTKDAANYALGLYESFRGKNPTFLMENKNFIIIGSIPKTLFQAKDEMTIAQYREGNINTYAKEDFLRSSMNIWRKIWLNPILNYHSMDVAFWATLVTMSY